VTHAYIPVLLSSGLADSCSMKVNIKLPSPKKPGQLTLPGVLLSFENSCFYNTIQYNIRLMRT